MSLFDDASLVLTPNGYKGGVTTGKLYSIKPTSGLGDMTVSRNTTATRVNSAGLIESVAINVPRLDYPPLGGCPKILVEPLRTNNVFYSEQFDNAYWGKSLVTITPNAAAAPDNNTTADKFIPTNVANVHQIAKLALVSNAYAFSVFAKAGEETTFSMWLRNSSVGAIFNLSTGTVTPTPTPATSYKIEPYPNGWYRCSVYDATPGTDVRIYARNGSSFAGNNVNGFFLWGAQAEIASTVTSYIPTVAGTVTRNADVISKTGISSLIGQTEGTIYAEINNTLMTSYSTGYVMRIFADANNEVWIRKESGTNKYTARWRANSVDVYTQSNIAVLNGNNKIAIAYKSTNSAVYLNGNEIGTNAGTGAFSVAPSQIGIGSTSTADFFNDRIELATLFPTRLTNAQLATLTTL
jgi:hypothetical protein